MKKKLINSFIILSASSAITKLFSIINRMVLARLLDSNGMALYVLLLPTLSLCITLGQLGIPSAVFRLVSNPKYNNKKVIISASTLSFFTCIIVVIGLFLSSKFIAFDLLKSPDAWLPLLSLCIFIPLVGISGIIKNYFMAKENVYLVAKAQFIEEVARLGFSYFLISRFQGAPISVLITFAFLAMSIGELSSIVYMLYRLKYKPGKHVLKKEYVKDNLQLKDMLNIAMPLTGSRLYHSLVSFLEPITLMFVLTGLNMSQSLIQHDYAVISGYVISLLVTPTFFNNVIYRLFLPIITKDLVYNQKKSARRHLLIALFGCLLISVPFTIIFYFFPEVCLSLIYNTTEGAKYLSYMSIPFTLFYLQTPLTATLHALNKNKVIYIIGCIECTLEIALTYILAFHFQVLSVAMSLLFGLLITLILSAICVYYYVFKENRVLA
ncbi:MAG: oligosaccharide flippase family protein [Coprobacillaceae bacterium]